MKITAAQIRAGATVCALALAALALAADESRIDVAHSTIKATFRQESVPVEAPLRKFSGHIKYDASNPAGSTASIDVETGSFDMGDAAYNAEVRKKAWFDSDAFPLASFRSTAVRTLSPTRFEATGSLFIKGRSLNITVPITIVAAGLKTAFDGTLPVSRKAFGIGDPVWNDVIDDQVNVSFHLINADH